MSVKPAVSDKRETLSMRGLILSCLGQKEEGFELVRKGLRNNLKSYICWHVFGSIKRINRDYDEAIRAYLNALKYDNDNIQILRDLSLLQIQTKDLEGFLKTRYKMLMLRPAQRASWIMFALAHHLSKNYDVAIMVLNEFCKTLGSENSPYEQSELILYQNTVLIESGKIEQAYNHLNENTTTILDDLYLYETKVQCLVKLHRYEEAKDILWKLIKINPENASYIESLYRVYECQSVASVFEDDKFVTLLRQIEVALPRKSNQVQKFLIKHLCPESSEFVSFIDHYLREGLSKGTPSLIKTLNFLYLDKKYFAKIQIIQNLLLSYLKEDFKASPHKSPSEYLWANLFLAESFDKIADTYHALHHINVAIQHTPTLVELYCVKAKIYKHAGDMKEAVANMHLAQSLDTADRFINSKYIKYLFKANKVGEAEKLAAKFVRDGSDNTNVNEGMDEMQCLWYELASAEAHVRLNEPLLALEFCQRIRNHFQDIFDDQFDFHSYCSRKLALRAYVEMLRFEDKLFSQKSYMKTTQCAVNVYLGIHDQEVDRKREDLRCSNKSSANHHNHLDAEDKKARNKARKSMLKRESQESCASKKSGSVCPSIPDDSKVKESALSQPLEEGMKYLSCLLPFARNFIEVYKMHFDLAFRKAKILVLIKCVKGMLSIDALHIFTHECKVRLLALLADVATDKYPLTNGDVTELSEKSNEDLRKRLIAEEKEELFSCKSVVDINSEYLRRIGDYDVDAVFLVAKLYAELGMPNLCESTLHKVIDQLKRISIQPIASLRDSKRLYKACCVIFNDMIIQSGVFNDYLINEIKEDFIKISQTLFPLAELFSGVESCQSTELLDSLSKVSITNNQTCDNTLE